MNIHARHLAGVSFAVLAILNASNAFAQVASATDEGDDTPDRIIVTGARDNPLVEEAPTGSRLDLTPLQTPATVNTVTGEDIRARGDFDFMDAVSRAPGITNSFSPGEGTVAIAVRGFNGQGSVLNLFNGVRLFPNNSSITFPSDTWNIDRIEVLNGPGSVLYGQGALGGVVNVIPKSANFERFEAQAQAGYGSFDTTHAAAGIGGPIIADKLAFRADASYRRSDGYVDRGDSESLALSGSLEFRPTENLSLVLRHDFGDQEPMNYFGTPLVDGRLDTSLREENYNYSDALMDFRDNRTQLNIEWSPAEGVKVMNVTYLLDSYRKWESFESYSFNSDTGLVDRSGNTGLYHDVQQFGTQTTVSVNTPLGGSASNQFVIGAEYNEIDLDYSHNFDDVYEDSVDPFDFVPGNFYNTVGIIPRYRTETHNYALFLEDRIEFTEQLSVIGGLRYETNRVGRWNYVYDDAGETIIGETPAFNGGDTPYKRFEDFTWRVGAVYQPTPNLSFFGQYATGVDPVGTLTSFTTSGTQYGFTNATGDQIEAGVKAVFLDGRGSATLSAYRIVKNDLSIQRVTNGPIEQIGQQSSKGIEASVTIDLPAGFAIDANGTILDAEYEDFFTGGVDFSGNTPTGVPEKAANVTLSWAPIERLELRSSLRYVGRRFSDNANTLEMPSYVVVDAGASYALTPNVGIDLRVYNLFDKDYALDNYGAQQWILGRPRAFDVAVRASF